MRSFSSYSYQGCENSARCVSILARSNSRMPAKSMREMTLVWVADSQRRFNYIRTRCKQLPCTLYPNAFQIGMRR